MAKKKTDNPEDNAHPERNTLDRIVSGIMDVAPTKQFNSLEEMKENARKNCCTLTYTNEKGEVIDVEINPLQKAVYETLQDQKDKYAPEDFGKNIKTIINKVNEKVEKINPHQEGIDKNAMGYALKSLTATGIMPHQSIGLAAKTVGEQYNYAVSRLDKLYKSIDKNGFLVYKKSNGQDAAPEDRFLKVRNDKGGIELIAVEGQSSIIKAKIEGELPVEFAKNLYVSSAARVLIDTERKNGTEIGPAFANECYARAMQNAESLIQEAGRNSSDQSILLWKKAEGERKKMYKLAGLTPPKSPLSKEVVIKDFFPLQGDHSSGFIKEGALIGFAHANIMPTYFMGQMKEGDEFTVMPYIDQSKRLCKNSLSIKDIFKGLSITNVLGILEQSCNALGVVFKERGVIHRDIKPDNIMVIKEGDEYQVILSDFGIASIPEKKENSKTGMMAGTPTYLPAAQAFDAKRATHQSDLQSLAFVAYEWVTGKRYPANDDDPNSIRLRWIHIVNGAGSYRNMSPSYSLVSLLGEKGLKSEIGENIIDNSIPHGEGHDYSGFWGKRKLKNERKKALGQLEGIEKILARMIATSTVTGYLKSLETEPGNKAKLKAKIDLLKKDPNYDSIVDKNPLNLMLEYSDLTNGGPNSEKSRYVDEIYKLCYSNVEDIKKDIELIKSGEAPIAHDNRQKVFFSPELNIVRRNFFSIPHPLRLGALGTTLAASAGYGIQSGRLQEGIKYIADFVNSIADKF